MASLEILTVYTHPSRIGQFGPFNDFDKSRPCYNHVLVLGKPKSNILPAGTPFDWRTFDLCFTRLSLMMEGVIRLCMHSYSFIHRMFT